MNMEIWKTIKGYPDYKISNLGNVKSFKFGKENILKPGISGGCYFVVSICVDKKRKTFQIHQLVAIAFLNHIPCGYKLVINHKNFIRTDNRVENLEIVSQRENTNLKHINSSSKYVGVTWNKWSKKWLAQIQINGKSKHLGRFNCELKAHLAYQNELLTIKNK